MLNFEKATTEAKPVLIDFYANWCEPCKWLEPVLDELQTMLAAKASILKVNIDENPEIAAQYHVLSVPTLMLFKKGEAVWRMNGFMYSKELYKQIEKHL